MLSTFFPPAFDFACPSAWKILCLEILTDYSLIHSGFYSAVNSERHFELTVHTQASNLGAFYFQSLLLFSLQPSPPDLCIDLFSFSFLHVNLSSQRTHTYHNAWIPPLYSKHLEHYQAPNCCLINEHIVLRTRSTMYPVQTGKSHMERLKGHHQPSAIIVLYFDPDSYKIIVKIMTFIKSLNIWTLDTWC